MSNRLAVNSGSRTRSRLSAMLLAVCGAAAFAGCGILGGGKEVPQGGIEKVATKEAETVRAGEEDTKLLLVGSDKLNDCGGEQANILVVRVYQLRSDGALIGMSLSRLWDHEKEELGDDLLDQAEFVLEPGHQQELSISAKAGASVLAVAADFCATTGECWRWVRPWKSVGSGTKLIFSSSCIESAK